MLIVKHEQKMQYPIHFGHGFFQTELLKQLDSSAFFLCIDESVNRYYEDELASLKALAVKTLIIHASEDEKTQSTVDTIHEMLIKSGASRSSVLVAIGGGIIGDVVGYAASIFMRGIDFVQVPTTLLAQVDSSVGGKVAINQFGVKNIIGQFHTPKFVIIDTLFLSTLTDRHFKSGLVELIKHGLIADEGLFKQIDAFDNLQNLRENYGQLGKLIQQSVIIKKNIVENDFFDTGERQKLNFGHTFGHALEMSPGSNLTHGEAVAIGILVACLQSPLDEVDVTKVMTLFEKFECIKPLPEFDEQKIFFDKKRSSEMIHEVLLEGIGCAKTVSLKVCDLQEQFLATYAQLKEKELKLSMRSFISAPQKLTGSVVVPPSKSALHRYLLAASLSGEVVMLEQVNSLCEDVVTTMEVLRGLGTTCSWDEKTMTIKVAPSLQRKNIETFHMGESGTTLRMLLPTLIHQLPQFKMTGRGKLPTRSLQVYFDQLVAVTFDKKTDDNLPLRASGAILPGEYLLDGSESSQFISGLLYVLPLLDGDSVIRFSSPLVSTPYVQMTVDTLADFGVHIGMEMFPRLIEVKGNQRFTALKKAYAIEQDYSARAFWEVANVLGENEIEILPKAERTLQGDAVISQIISDGLTIFDLKDAPDLAPILAILFTQTGGRLSSVQRLVDKESNRLKAIMEFLQKMNVPYTIVDDVLTIKKANIAGGEYNTHFDHRITMALLVASTIAQAPFVLKEIESIDKSYPKFIVDFERLGG